MKLRPAALAVLAVLSSLTVGAGAQEARKTYIVQLSDQPATTYVGGVSGYPATQPAPGAVFDYRDPKVQNYVRYLGDRKADVLASVGNPVVIANYDVVLNGFAALLTDSEVLALKGNPAVADVQADAVRRMDTISTPRFLGLSTAGGLWSQFAGGSQVKGENMVVGIVDGGIWPENPAFADRVDGNGVPTFDAGGSLAYNTAPASFTGGCAAGEGFDPAIHCNNKLVGAKYYNAGFLASGRPKNWTEFYSPRDSNVGGDGVTSGHGGHGDHTASTAAGNSNVPAVVAGIPMGPASGVAPRARVAAYKVCWTYDDPTADDGTGASNSCFNSDSVQAIDDAVKDGVNAINFSISGAQNTVNDAVEQAFYRASLAGVFVAASAGNSGPANAVAHISPWLTTVAASTHDRNLVADATTGSGSKYTGASLNTKALPQTALVRAEDAGLGGGNANLCFSSSPPAGQVMLDPAKVAGKVVICTRGTNARVDKSLAVLNAGGVGMVMADNGGGLVAEAHSVPSVHISAADGAAIKAYALAQGAAATTAIGTFYPGSKPAPVMAGFSSRGPNMGDANVLKPDLTAPGVDIIASVSAALTPAQHSAVVAGSFVPPAAYESYQGTSMSSPHVAGLSLLLRQAHPDWSPAAVKSALMTTTYSTLNDGLPGAQNGLLPWSQGAGHVDPNKAVDPGLVYDMGKADYVQYQCKVNRPAVPAADCSNFGTLDETYNLNLPSITVSTALGGVGTTVRRKVTNVGPAATYTATASLPGFSVVVSPSSLTLATGQSGSFTVKLTPNGAPANAWQFGSLAWNDGSHNVRIPVQAKVGKAVTAPAILSGDKASGSRLFPVLTGFSGRMGYAKGGLKAASYGDAVTLEAKSTSSAVLKTLCTAGADTANVKVYKVSVPAGAVAAKFALFQKDSGASDDHDLGVLTPGGAWSYSGNDGSNESVQLASPAAGTYNVCVVAYGSTTPEAMQHKLASWVVSTADTGGKFVVAVPSKVVAGNNTTVGVSWSGLDNNQSYVGAAQFLDLNGVVQATTLVNVSTGAAAVPIAETDRVAAAKLQD
ncbi:MULTISPECIES: S8 family serine peptidase [unclassified Duganella]|uniref:S8 family serine peptidase n=1 Tax=unclassified Duganella TaxID=2636909 RepID=UPI0006FCA4FA|nr:MULTISPECIES: S8 family serine peptidase [unclassified Duganella]KQV45516.1 peptidase S8 and S53 subtilisin kexin sedolisin [Duganella sp. Root336D2]KRC00840.1 peptidase S8 and S53 subtilisin kexin sedolisin [Duganella sp. Root198D2]